MKKFLLIVILILFGCWSNPVCTLASGEQSVLELIGKDGDSLANQVLMQKLTVSPETKNDCFGRTVSISENIAIVGANWSGSAYIYERDESGVWNKKQKLTASDEATNYGFGSSVAISNNVAIVGETNSDDGGSWVYIFERNGSEGWTQKQKINVSVQSEVCQLAIAENVLIVGDISYDDYTGIAYIFERDESGDWIQKQQLTPGNDNISTYFGYSVAILGNIAIVGATGDQDKGNFSGSAHIFERNELGFWSEKQKLTASDGSAFDLFGESIALSGNVAIVGATGDEKMSGSAYIFEQDESGFWSEKQKLTVSDGGAGKSFGRSISISGNLAIIGTPFDDDKGTNSGSAYIFEQDESGFWSEKQKLNASDGSVGDSFGYSVAISGNNVIVGADGDASIGSIYFFNLVELQSVSDLFKIPSDKRYLIFKVARNSTISTKDKISNKIRFEAVGLKSNAVEEVYPVTLSYPNYLEGFTSIYYFVDITELLRKYVEVCKNKFQLGDGGRGISLYNQVELRVRYDSPVNTNNNLVDVYVADEVNTSEKATEINLTANTSGVTVKWPAQTNDWIKGFQVYLTDTPNEPNIGVDKLEIQQEPYYSRNDLSAQKIYYFWIRAVNQNKEVSSWICQKFSPKAAESDFIIVEPVSGIGNNGKPTYNVNLQVKPVDTAWYVIERRETGKAETLQEIFRFKPNSPADLCRTDGNGLVKHGDYEYYVHTENALGEPTGSVDATRRIIPNITPEKCELTKTPRLLEVNQEVAFVLGPKSDIEGDQLTYKLYRRIPGVGSGECIETWTPEVDNQQFTTTKFEDKVKYQWQIRCVENGVTDQTEVVNKDWQDLKVDVDGIIVLCTNQKGLNWGTVEQRLDFKAEINKNKTYSDYQWDFGVTPPESAIGNPVFYTYKALGEYKVKVTAQDASGQQHTGEEMINVVKTPMGELCADETWTGTHVVEGEVTVPKKFTLTINPGTTVQFKAGGSIKVVGNGTLYAVDPGAGIKFQLHTSENPNLTSWSGIKIEEAGSGTLTGMTISKANQGIKIDSVGRITINKATFSNNFLGLEYLSGTPILNECYFIDNGYGLKDGNAEQPYPVLQNRCTFEGNNMHYIDGDNIEWSGAEVNAFELNSTDNVFGEKE